MRKNLGLLLGIGLGLGLGAAQAQDTDIGATLYRDFCAACHGASAQGDGDMADVVQIPAANLTQLSKNNDGEFPMLKVIQIIDGRTGLRPHGSAMPIWGQVFSDDAQSDAGLYGSVLETRGRILSLAMYLETLQK